MVHSLAKNHALVDGDKRLALAGVVAFLGVDGVRLTMSNDQAYEFILSIADGTVTEVADIAGQLNGLSEPWS